MRIREASPRWRIAWVVLVIALLVMIAADYGFGRFELTTGSLALFNFFNLIVIVIVGARERCDPTGGGQAVD